MAAATRVVLSASTTASESPPAEATTFVSAVVPDGFQNTKPGEVQDLVVKKSVALRTKYRQGLGAQRISPNFLGWDPSNRNGIDLNADRCEQLTEGLIGHFDPDEADHGSIAVEEQEGESRVDEVNRKRCGEEKRLACGREMMRYGTLGHSHLNQVLKNASNGAVCLRSSLQKYCKNGCLSMDLIRVCDPDFAEACANGLRWEVLHSRIRTEEPEGLQVIQRAMNHKHAVAMSNHEMQHLSLLQATLMATLECGVATEVNLKRVQEQLMAQGSLALGDLPRTHLVDMPPGKVGFQGFAYVRPVAVYLQPVSACCSPILAY